MWSSLADSCSGVKGLATRQPNAGTHDLGRGERLGLVGSTNEGAVSLANDRLGNGLALDVPNLSRNDEIQSNHFPFGVVGGVTLNIPLVVIGTVYTTASVVSSTSRNFFEPSAAMV